MARFSQLAPRDQMDERSYYLHANQRLSQEAPATNTYAEVDQYRYDPANPTPSVGGPLLDPGLVGPRDNRALEARPVKSSHVPGVGM
jgi:uncharacterized protein